MARKSAVGKTVRCSADDPTPTTPEELADLLAGMDEEPDLSDIPEFNFDAPRVLRDAEGRLVKGRQSPIRAAILAELDRRKMTRYKLWKKARVLCGTLPRSAVYEYLRGQREIGLPYAEAMMQDVGLVVRRPLRPVTSAPPRRVAKTK